MWAPLDKDRVFHVCRKYRATTFCREGKVKTNLVNLSPPRLGRYGNQKMTCICFHVFSWPQNKVQSLYCGPKNRLCVFFTSQHLFSRLNILTTCTPRCTDVAMCFTPPGLCMVRIPLRTFYASHSHRLGLCFVPYYRTQTLKTPSVLWLQLKDSIIVKYRGQLGGAKAEEGKGGNCIL